MKKTFLTVLLTTVIMVLASCNNATINEFSTPATEETTNNTTYTFKTNTSVALWDEVEPKYEWVETIIDLDIPEGSDVPPFPITQRTKVLVNTPPRVLVRLTLTGDVAFDCCDDLEKVGFIRIHNKPDYFLSRNVYESDDNSDDNLFVYKAHFADPEKEEYRISAEKEMSYEEALEYIKNDYIELNAETLYNNYFEISGAWVLKPETTATVSNTDVNAKPVNK